MLLQITLDSGKLTSINVNHIIQITPDVYDKTKIKLTNGEEIVSKTDYKTLHEKISKIYLNFYYESK